MAQIQTRANLTNDDIPLLSAYRGQTVIVGKFDQDYLFDTNPNNVQRLQREKEIADAYYAHNIVPTGQGYKTIGYVAKLNGLAGITSFDKAYVLRDPAENKSFFAPAAGKNYIFDRNINTWRSISPIVGAESSLVTVAYLSGETYIYYQKIGCFKYNKTTGTLDAVVLTGLVPILINGICSAAGFLLAWDDLNNIYRSQAASPLNFTPDASLGSGAGIPEEIRGKIVVLFPITNGFIVYTTANAVAASFQQNIRYPFIFKEIDGSSGIVNPDHVSWQDNTGEHYVWSKSGLQKLNKSKSVQIFPVVSDFLAAKVFEDYDEVNDAFLIQKLTSQLNVKLTVIGSRWLVISYGVAAGTYTHALFYDIAFKRWGKLKITHTDVFNYAVPNLSGNITWNMLTGLSWTDLGSTSWNQLATQVQTAETPNEIMGFMKRDGSVSIANFDQIHTTGDSGVLVLGKYQFSRANLLVMDEIAVENVDPNSDFSLRLLTSMDGKTTFTVSIPYNDVANGNFRNFLSDKVGINHSIVGKGTFNFSSIEMVFHPHGRA
jgi:hypothetical protein